MAQRSYHHGDLRAALLAAAVEVIDESGPAALSLRDLARRVGVSHAAPAHHFGDKTGLLTALATEGFELLAEALAPTRPPGDLVELGVGYVLFAVQHRAHFEVMFRPDLLHQDDPGLVAAQAGSQAALWSGVAGLPERRRGDDPRLASVTACVVRPRVRDPVAAGGAAGGAGGVPGAGGPGGRAVLRRRLGDLRSPITWH